MRFPDPVAVSCAICGYPTVLAETPTGVVWVHCGTWRWQCDASAKPERDSLPPADGAALGAPSDQWAA